jgi:hypothetical protein
LQRPGTVALYAVIAELLASFVRNDYQDILRDWFLEFERRRRAQDELSEDEADPEWIQYKEKRLSSSRSG